MNSLRAGPCSDPWTELGWTRGSSVHSLVLVVASLGVGGRGRNLGLERLAGGTQWSGGCAPSELQSRAGEGGQEGHPGRLRRGGGCKLRGILSRFPCPRVTALEGERSRLFLFLVCGVAPTPLHLVPLCGRRLVPRFSSDRAGRGVVTGVLKHPACPSPFSPPSASGIPTPGPPTRAHRPPGPAPSQRGGRAVASLPRSFESHWPCFTWVSRRRSSPPLPCPALHLHNCQKLEWSVPGLQGVRQPRGGAAPP